MDQERLNTEDLISWEGYGPEENSWEPVENLQNAADAVWNFHRLHPDAVGSTRLGGGPMPFDLMGGVMLRVDTRLNLLVLSKEIVKTVVVSSL